MIRLRCPHHGCPIDVADDMLGARIRCPHCAQLLFVEAQNEEPSDPPPDAPHAVAAGMPPLAAMLGIREGHGRHWGDAGPARANMTDLDWRALAAFEKVLYAVGALWAAIGFGIATALLTMLLLWIASTQVQSSDTPLMAGPFIFRLAVLLMLGTCFALMALGRHRLYRMRLGAPVTIASLAALAVAVVYGLYALTTAQALFNAGDHLHPPVVPMVLAIPLQLVGAFFAGRACFLVQRAHEQASPHAIRNRLIAALDYLDWLAREQYLSSVAARPRRRLP